MTQTQVSVEWLFNETKTYFKSVSLKLQNGDRIKRSYKTYCVCALR